jgi:hypothetical protein
VLGPAAALLPGRTPTAWHSRMFIGSEN